MTRAAVEVTWLPDPAEDARRRRRSVLWVGTLTLLALLAAIAFAWERTHPQSAIPQAVVWLVLLFGWLPARALYIWLKASRFRFRLRADAHHPYRIAPLSYRLRFDAQGIEGSAPLPVSVPWKDVKSVVAAARSVDIIYVAPGSTIPWSIIVPHGVLDDEALFQVQAWHRQSRPSQPFAR